jgi:hypothetical protein
LANNQYVRVLSEPTLVAYNGEEATFLVGGEVPIPISDLGEGTTSISIEYREYGIRCASSRPSSVKAASGSSSSLRSAAVGSRRDRHPRLAHPRHASRDASRRRSS